MLIAGSIESQTYVSKYRKIYRFMDGPTERNTHIWTDTWIYRWEDGCADV